MNRFSVIAILWFLLVPCLSSLAQDYDLPIASRAQDKKKEFSATIGFAANHEELGTAYLGFAYGGHIGFNLYSRELKRFKSDLQASVNFSGKNNASGSLLTFNALYGGRYYILNPEKPTKVFANVLAGPAFIAETGGDFTENRFGLGYSAGIFVVFNRFVVGTSAESYNNFIFKVGYTF